MTTRRLLIGIAALAISLGAAWTFWPAGADPKVAELQAKADQIFTTPPTKPEEFQERREKFMEFRQQMEDLSPEQRREVMKKPPPFARAMQREIEKFHALPQAERRKFLDKKIDEMEAMRKGMQAMFAASGSNGSGKEGTPPRPPGMSGMSPERGKEMRDAFLNNTTPQQRAQMTEFMQAMQERRRERGMEQLPAPPF